MQKAKAYADRGVLDKAGIDLGALVKAARTRRSRSKAEMARSAVEVDRTIAVAPALTISSAGARGDDQVPGRGGTTH